MIPILYSAEETAFTSNGIGRLSDCISCEVTEERNGEYEAEFRYPINGIHYDEIEEGKIILVDHDEQKDAQPFIIYRRSAPINGVVTFNAHHISYILSNVIIRPFTASSVADAFNTFTNSNMNTNPFTFWTDNSTGGAMKSEVPASVRSLLGGSQGSILDVFGGEYMFDKFLVRNYANRGSDKGVTIRYGKNLSDITWEVDTMDLYGSVVPFWSDGESTVVYGSIVSGSGATNRVTTLDLSSEFEEQPTVADLESRAASFLASNQPWIPKENIKINFIPLWQTDEYADVAPLERVCLCDTVTVYYTDLGVQATAKVIKVVWDALLEKYTTIELGQAQSSFADTIIGTVDNKIAEAVANVPTTSAVQAAIDNATELITGGKGGHIVFLYDADGKPTDMLVMDTDDVNTAVNVLRINVNGIGFSSTGPSGPFTSAWTLDGSFVADWITAGHLSANRIQGGTLTLGGNNNGNGVLVVYDASGTEIGRWDKDGIFATGNLVMQSTHGGDTSKSFIGRQRMLARRSLGSSSAYSRSEAQGSIMQSIYKRTGYTDAFTYYKSINMDGAWTGETTLANGIGVRAVLACIASGGRYWDATILDSDTSLSSLLSYTTAYLEMVENVHALLGTVDWKLNGYGTHGGTDYSQIDACLHLGGKGYIHADSDNAIFSTGGNGVRIKYSLTNISYNSNNWYIVGNTVSGYIAVSSSSSRRYKHDITDQIDEELDAHRLYDLTMKQFVYNDDCESWQYCDLKGRTIPGFIAEEVEEIYPSAVIHDPDGRIESWDERRLIPGMLKLIQEQHEEIEDLKARLSKLEKVVEALAI